MRRRAFSILLTGCLLLTLCGASIGQEADGRIWRISAGVFLPTNAPSGTTGDAGYSVSAGVTLRQDTQGQWLGSLRYSRYRLSSGSDIELVNPMVEYHWRFGADQRVYAGPGLGMIFGKNRGGGNTSSVAVSLAAGYNFSALFAEARYVSGVKKGENGFILSVGGRF